MTRSIWARDHLVSYLAGGLSTEERFEIQELLKTDADLAAALAELQTLDERVRKLFVAAKPRLGFEDRVIRSLREKSVTAVRERRLNVPVKWVLMAASLLIVVAGGLFAVESLQYSAPKSPQMAALYDGGIEALNMTGLPRDDQLEASKDAP